MVITNNIKVEKMVAKSNTDLILEVIKPLKHGNVQTTARNIAVTYGRNYSHLIQAFKLLESQKYIKVSVMGEWKLI